MQELMQRLMEEGLEQEQAEQSIQVLNEWLKNHYPVAGVLVDSWIRNQLTGQKPQ